MEREHLQHMNTVLNHKKQELETGVAQMQTDLATMPQNLADPADQATLSTDRQFALLRQQRLLHELREVEQTLSQLANGEYGLCEECGEEIGLARLTARPSARLCIDCQEHLERAA